MKRALLAGAALLLLGLVAVGIFAGLRYRQGQDVRGSSTEEFTPTEAAPPPPPEPGVFWPAFGFDPSATRVVDYPHRPPFKVRWFFRARTLVEFPPAIGYGRLYFTNNYGRAVRREREERRARVEVGLRTLHRELAGGQGPARDPGLPRPAAVQPRGEGLDGLVVAFYVGSGKVRWKRGSARARRPR